MKSGEYMIKTKLIGITLASIIAGTSIIGVSKILTIMWSGQNNLTQSATNVNEYINKVNYSMKQATQVIQSDNSTIEKNQNLINQQQSEINNLNNEIDKMKNTNGNNQKIISNLNNAIARLEGASNYKNMTIQQKKDTINTLLRDWGYGKASIAFADEIFNVSEHWFFVQKENSNQKINQENNNYQGKIKN